LDVLRRVVVDGFAGLLVDALRPVDVIHVGLGEQRLAVGALIGIEEAVAAGMGDELARLAATMVSIRMWVPASSKSH